MPTAFSLLVLACCFAVGCQTSDPPTSIPAIEPGPVDDDAPTEFVTMSSGLKYRILRKGDGVKPAGNDLVKVHYVGKLDNGAEFDNSYTNGKPLTIRLDSAVVGWQKTLPLLSKGGMIELQIPSSLGYGKTGVGDKIPPFAILHFKVELLNVLIVEPGRGKIDKPDSTPDIANG